MNLKLVLNEFLFSLIWFSYFHFVFSFVWLALQLSVLLVNLFFAEITFCLTSIYNYHYKRIDSKNKDSNIIRNL